MPSIVVIAPSSPEATGAAEAYLHENDAAPIWSGGWIVDLTAKEIHARLLDSGLDGYVAAEIENVCWGANATDPAAEAMLVNAAMVRASRGLG